MSDKHEADMPPEDEAEAPAEADEAAEAAVEAAETETEAEPPSAEETIADLEDKWRRALAEVHNVRRRADEEHRNALRYGIRGFARDMLSVCDNLERALEAAQRPAEGGEAGGGGAGAGAGGEFLAGIQAIQRELHDILARHGVQPIQALGERFDPNYHEAVFEAQQEGARDFDVVVAVVQSGYMIGERLLRPAQVGVARANGKPAADEAKPDEQPEEPPPAAA